LTSVKALANNVDDEIMKLCQNPPFIEKRSVEALEIKTNNTGRLAAKFLMSFVWDES
jgi:hypothetical protein